jgi:hypothetical protein
MLSYRQSPSLSPVRLEPGLIGNWDPCDPNSDGSLSANNSAISTYFNSETNGINFVQAAGVSQPTYLLSPFNGKPLVRFGGLQVMSAAVSGVTWFNFVRNFTIGGLFRLSASGNIQQTIISKGNSNSAPNWMVQVNRTTANGKVSFWNGSSWMDATVGVSSTTDLNCYSVSWDGSTFQLYLNGNSSAPTGVAVDVTSSTQPLTLGGQGAVGPTNLLNGDVGPQLIWASPFSAAQHVNFHRFMSNFYGLNFAV